MNLARAQTKLGNPVRQEISRLQQRNGGTEVGRGQKAIGHRLLSGYSGSSTVAARFFRTGFLRLISCNASSPPFS